MPEPVLIDRVLRRDQWIVGACLALVVVLSWAWLLRMGIAMKAPAGSAMGPMPMAATGTLGAPWPIYVASAFVMWFLMMVAMMTPSAAPMILLYSRLGRSAEAQGGGLAPTLFFAGVYLAVWAAFSLLAALIQTALVQSGFVSATTLALGDRRVAGALLVAAGLYQATPLKQSCLKTCRSPVSFLTRGWRPGWIGALRLGVEHGAYCVGCCWLIMSLLFVVGVMNLIWVGALALLVLLEKVAPLGRRGGLVFGGAAALAGTALIFGMGLSA